MKPLNRRRFIQGAAIAPFVAKALWAQAGSANQKYLMFAGTQTGVPGTTGAPASEGIYAYRWDAKNGSLTSLGVAAKCTSPTFIAFNPDHKILIAASETDKFVPGSGDNAEAGLKTGAVSSYSVAGPRLTMVNTVAAHGAGTCHVSVDHTGQAAFAANYNGGSAASFHLGADGHLSPAVSVFHYHFEGKTHGPDAERQEAAHAHRTTVSPENKFVFVNDLGLDCIHIYRLDAATAKLTPSDPPQWDATPGSGPRALRFHPSGRWAYCVNELASTIDVLGWDAATGRFSLIQTLGLAAAGYKGTTRASEIVFDRSGQFGYAANRDNNFLATLIVHEGTGKLTLIDRSSCGGKTPRHIALDPTEQWLLVANQDSDVISTFKRDAKTGKLAATGGRFPLTLPMCLLFA